MIYDVIYELLVLIEKVTFFNKFIVSLNQMYCTLTILLPAPVCAGFVAGSNFQVLFGIGH